MVILIVLCVCLIDFRTTQGLVQGVHHRFCTLIQRADGYGYSLTTIVPTKGDAGIGAAYAAALSLPDLMGHTAHNVVGVPRAQRMKQSNNPEHLRNFALRLNAALDAAGVSPKGRGRQIEVARAMGMSIRGARRWLEGETYPAPDKFPDLASRYGTTVDWLLGGRGDAPHGVTTTRSGPRCGHIPHITWAAIRTWVETGVVDPEDMYTDIHTIDGMGSRGFAVSVPDDTMMPDFPEGGVLYMDPDLEPLSGDYVLALTDTGGVTFKRLILDGGRTFLRPLNPAYAVQQVADLKAYGVLRRLVVTRDFRR